MKITSFNPLVVTSNAEALIGMFEELGFESKHKVENIAGQDITNYDMKDANGFRMDVTNAPGIEQDMMMIRMNVDDFDEAMEFLTSKGFENSSGRVVETRGAKSARMVAPSGFAFDLCQHIK